MTVHSTKQRIRRRKICQASAKRSSSRYGYELSICRKERHFGNVNSHGNTDARDVFPNSIDEQRFAKSQPQHLGG